MVPCDLTIHSCRYNEPQINDKLCSCRLHEYQLIRPSNLANICSRCRCCTICISHAQTRQLLAFRFSARAQLFMAHQNAVRFWALFMSFSACCTSCCNMLQLRQVRQLRHLIYDPNCLFAGRVRKLPSRDLCGHPKRQTARSFL